MSPSNRRAFMSDVGRGMLAAGLGTSLAGDLGFSTAFANEGPDSIPLGGYARLVELMRNTPAEKLQPVLAKKIVEGEANLKQLTAAGALANAVTFGGCDYVGFHTAMAMLPALEMSGQLPSDRKPLPVLKVLYRNSQQIQNVGGRGTTAMHAADVSETAGDDSTRDLGEQIRDACRGVNVELGEKLLATVGDSPLEAFNALQPAMQDDLNVHRFVFAHRTYELAGLLGNEFSYSLLRQCVRFCVNHEGNRIEKSMPEAPIRALVPKLLDEYKLAGAKLGKRDPGDAAVEKLSETIYHGPRQHAAVQIYGQQGHAVEPVFRLLLKYAVSEDGRLHAEKYYHTVREEYRTIRSAFRWRQVMGLARVTASAYGYNREDEHGFRAAGYEDACKLLGVRA